MVSIDGILEIEAGARLKPHARWRGRSSTPGYQFYIPVQLYNTPRHVQHTPHEYLWACLFSSLPDHPLYSPRARVIQFYVGEKQRQQQKKEIDRQKWTVLKENGCGPSSSCGFESGQLEVSLNPRLNPFIDADGRLVITAGKAKHRKGGASNGHSSSQGDEEIASTRLSTYGSADFLHGRVVVRAKVTRGGWGGSSGIWLMPSEERRPDRPSCARVNIVEVIC